MTLKVFIDTEFTDFVDTYLISIGMVADSGEEFYAELPYPEHKCSTFVCEVVIPLLGRIPDSDSSIEELPARMMNWLQVVRRNNEEVQICFDYQTDWDLFAKALDNLVPKWCTPRVINRNINELLRYKFHKSSKMPEHHALYDALANRYAFRERP